MNLFSIIIYILLLGVPLLMIYQSFLLKTKYPIKFLNSFSYYIVFFYSYGFIAFSTRIFFAQIGIQDSHFLNMVLSSIIFPLNIISLYYLLIWTGELIQKPIKKLLKIIYWILQAIAFLIFFFVSIKAAETKQSSNFSIFFIIINTVELIFAFYPFLVLVFLHNKVKSNIIKNFSIILGIQYLFLFPFLIILIEFFHLPSVLFKSSIHIHYFIIICYYFANIPPIIYIQFFLKKNHHLFLKDKSNSEQDKELFIKYHIGQKEKEIIDLIIKGKTNEAIGDILFCSTKTVKNNITAIYKKLGVKSRVELVSFVLSNQKN